MQSDIPTRVARGVALLDEQEPGWVNKIDLSMFAIGTTDNCVLGQVYGDFGTGVEVLGLCSGEEGCREGEYGFDSDGSGMKAQIQEFKELQAEWVRVLTVLRQKNEAKGKELVRVPPDIEGES